MTIRDQLAALVAARAKATDGEWRRNEDSRPGMSWNTFVSAPSGDIFSPFHSGGDDDEKAESVDGNVDFVIAAANFDLPGLLARMDELEAARWQCTSRAIRDAFSAWDHLCHAEKWDTIEQELAALQVGQEPAEVMLAILTVTMHVADKCPGHYTAYARVKAELVRRMGNERAESNLRGLEAHAALAPKKP